MPKIEDRTGQTFGRLTVLARAANRVRGGKQRSYWLCRCVCGNEPEVMGESLKSGNTKSCGCLDDHRGSTTHGKHLSRAYSAWAAAKARCGNPNHQSYARYGGRGIAMAPEWLDSFEAFFRDMGDAPEGKELERVDNNGPYSPDNCVWATRSQQVRNQERWRVDRASILSRWLELRRNGLSAAAAAKTVGRDKGTLYEWLGRA